MIAWSSSASIPDNAVEGPDMIGPDGRGWDHASTPRESGNALTRGATFQLGDTKVTIAVDGSSATAHSSK